MWMAAGFTMLEAGLVRAKNTAEILTKNVGLYSIACIMYMLCGYAIMYGRLRRRRVRKPLDLGSGLLGSADNAVAAVLAGDAYYSNLSDFFFQVVFVATAMSIVSGAVAERMKLWSFFLFSVVLTGFIYPVQGLLEVGRRLARCGRLPRFRRLGRRAPVRRRCGARRRAAAGRAQGQVRHRRARSTRFPAATCRWRRWAR